MKPLPTLRQLRFLVAVVERRHFGAAAEDCLVSQSALSAAIQELEELLGVKLLERTKRVVIPTAVGLDLAERAKNLLRGAEELVEAAQDARDPLSGALQLGVIPTIGPFLIPRIMPVLREAFPKLKIYIREEQSAPILTRLESGQADAAIIALPYPCDGLETMELARDRFYVVFPPDHRLAGRKKIRPQDMAAEDLLLLEDGHCLREHALAACSLEGARRNSGFQGTSLHTLVQMAANGLGVTLVPEMAIDAGILRGLNLVAAPLVDDSPPRIIALAWRLSSSRKAMFRQLGEVLSGALRVKEAGEIAPVLVAP
ncbi:hydrogen peroxide-inducible genes activator [Rhodoblastus sp. 17X3]|uniref:hydrogen peroxide-inducible genes activator n=1 Tax=Rhodoblastus sp. 17X3 TaxID=3047026 RepID=UPI0024B78556|nr:hydrogen peroxide-inducible genes activator [Rhodoblastus sp. 17X3]MDI9847260.1 hydrogen peroxide-inducible genes activator [Rhodoblastus sp. 17X3]